MTLVRAFVGSQSPLLTKWSDGLLKLHPGWIRRRLGRWRRGSTATSSLCLAVIDLSDIDPVHRERRTLYDVTGTVLLFRSRHPGRVKVVHHDGSVMVLVSKWSDRGSFRRPPVSEGALRPFASGVSGAFRCLRPAGSQAGSTAVAEGVSAVPQTARHRLSRSCGRGVPWEEAFNIVATVAGLDESAGHPDFRIAAVLAPFCDQGAGPGPDVDGFLGACERESCAE